MTDSLNAFVVGFCFMEIDYARYTRAQNIEGKAPSG